MVTIAPPEKEEEGGGRQGRGRRAKLALEWITVHISFVSSLLFLFSYFRRPWEEGEGREPQGAVKLRGRVSD